jgi:hypothetical protein
VTVSHSVDAEPCPDQLIYCINVYRTGWYIFSKSNIHIKMQHRKGSQTRRNTGPFKTPLFTAATVRPPRFERLVRRTPTTYLGSCGYILCRRRNESYESLFSWIDLGRTPR